jgi:hypothetical protein
MSESFLERLSQFTPDSGALDRDALLFAAGRASARANRGWIGLAALLATTQALALAVLWSQPTPRVGRGFSVATSSAPPAVREHSTTQAMASPGVWTIRHELRESEIEDGPDDAVTLMDAGPPLRAFAAPPASLWN